MEGEGFVQASVSAQCEEGGEPRPPYTIGGLRDYATWIASFAAQFEAEKAAVEVEKASVEAKLRKLVEREEDFKSLGSYIEERTIRLREVEEELEGKRKECEAKEKELELKREVLEKCLCRFWIREKGFEEQLAEFKEKQAEFQVRLSELSARERGIHESETQCKQKEREFEQRVDEFYMKEVKLDSRLAELSKKESEIDEKEMGFRERFVEFEAKQVKFEDCLRELQAKEREIEEKEERFRKKLEDSKEKEMNFKEDASRWGVKERVIVEKEKQSVELQLKLQQGSVDLVAREKMLPELDMDINEKDLDSKEKHFEKECKDSKLVDKNLAESLSSGVKMNGIDLQIFLNERHKDLDTLKVEVQNALKLLSDPAKLVLDAMQGFYPPHLKKGDIEFEVDVVRKSCIMLLEQLANMSTEIKPTTRNEAMSLALDWMTKMKPDVDHFLEVLAFLQLLAAYRLASAFDVDELVIQFGVIAHYSQVRVLLQNLGFAEKMSGVIRKLLENNCQAEAGSLISAFDLHSEFLWTTSPKDDQVTGLGPSLEDKSTAFTDPAILFSFNAPSIPLVSRTLSGAKLSWSDACAYSDLTEYPDLGPESALNLHVQQPERLSSHEPQLDRLNIPAQQPDRLHIPDQQPERLNIQDQQSERLSNGNDQAICNIKFYEKVPLPSRSAFVPGCLKINGNLFTAVCSKIKGNQLRCREISVALQRASDPTEFVLGIVKNPSSLTLQKGCGSVGLASPQHGPLLLLDLLRRMSPHVNQDVEREALSFAREWRPKFPKHLSNPLEPVCFLLFLAAYKLVSYFDQDELFSVFGKDSYWCQNGTKLFGLLDFKDLIPKFLEYLMRNKLPLETLHCIKISNLLESSPSARTALKNYMHTCPKKLRGTEGTDEQVVSIGRELNVWKPVAESITDQTLAECFRDHISVLEKKLQALKNSEPVPGETPSVPELFDYQQQREVPVAAVKPASVPIFSDDQQEQPGKRRQRQGSGARCKRRRMSDIRNGLCSAPPLVSNTKLRLPQLPVPFTAPFRPPAAATVVYPNQFYGFPGHWYPLIPYRYHGHGR